MNRPGGRPGHALAYVCLAASMALTGSYVGLSKLLLLVFPVLLLAWLRFGIGALAMLSWLWRPADEPPLTAYERRLLFLESFLGNFGFSICMLYGVALTSALSAGVVMAALPAAVALLSRLFLHERIQARMQGAIALAACGIAVLAWSRHAAPPLPSPQSDLAPWQVLGGHALLLVAVFCEASYMVIGKRLSTRLGPRRQSALINLWGLTLMTPFGLWQAWGFDFASVALQQYALLASYALAASVGAAWLWMRGLASVPASRAGIFTVMLPIGAATVGIAVLGEKVGAGHVLALGLALAGLLLATWPEGETASS